jgi:hypothetical protein
LAGSTHDSPWGRTGTRMVVIGDHFSYHQYNCDSITISVMLKLKRSFLIDEIVLFSSIIIGLEGLQTSVYHGIFNLIYICLCLDLFGLDCACFMRVYIVV